MLPAVLTLASAGLNFFGARKAGKAASKYSRAQEDLYRTQKGIAEGLYPFAKDFYGRAKESFDPVAAYYRDVTGGDRSRAVVAAAPELRGIDTKYENVVRMNRTLTPRSGASAAFNADLALRAADERQAAIENARAEARGGMANLAQIAGNLGSGAASAAVGAAGGASGSLTSAYRGAADAQKSQAQMYADLGSALADLIGEDDQGWYIGKRRGKG